jgi:rare lipoprotein A (peptidoglycan hydrolase)
MFNQQKFNEDLIMCNKTRFREEKVVLGFCYAFVVVVFIAVILLINGCSEAWAETTEASYYTVKSCLAESGQYRMANGRLLDDSKATFASWDFDFGQKLLIRANGKSVVAVCTDRGPSRRLYRKGRKLDLSAAAFRELAPLSKGVITVTYEVI